MWPEIVGFVDTQPVRLQQPNLSDSQEPSLAPGWQMLLRSLRAGRDPESAGMVSDPSVRAFWTGGCPSCPVTSAAGTIDRWDPSTLMTSSLALGSMSALSLGLSAFSSQGEAREGSSAACLPSFPRTCGLCSCQTGPWQSDRVPESHLCAP